MNNSTCEIRLAESFGTMQDARYLGNHLGIRVSRTHLLGRGIHVDMSTLAQQAGFQIHVFFRREAFAHLTENQSQSAAVVVHPLLRHDPRFEGEAGACLPLADPVETVLDLYELGLTAQAGQLMTHLRPDLRLP